MKSFEIKEFGIDELAFSEVQAPQPRAGEVLVKMKAASLNFRDLMMVKGLYNPKLRRPLVPLSDGSGAVVQCGPGVTKFKEGDRVTAAFMQTWLDGGPSKEKGDSALGGKLDGVCREYAVFSEEGLVATPAYLSDIEAATLPCAAVTAWNALFEQGPHFPGESVLIQGTGGVSMFALQFAVAAGMKAIVISSSVEKMERVKATGASEAVNYKESPEWDEAVRKLTGGVGVDRVVEVGGSGTLPRSLRAVKIGGTVCMIGALSGGDSVVSPIPILMNSIRVQGIFVGSRTMFERMDQFIELRGIKPVIDRVFAWTDFKDALRHMESQQHFGKICLEF